MRKLLAALWIIFPSYALAQDSLLRLDEAIKLAMTNNYGLRIASNTIDKATNNNSAGNAGMLPNVNLSGGYSRSTNNLNQKFANGLEVDRSNVGATNSNAAAALNWTLFDGLKMFYTKDRLDQSAEQARSLMKVQIESTLEQVIAAYFTIVRNNQLLTATNEEIVLSRDRVKIAERKLNNGSGSKLELLQAQTDLNRQLANEWSIKSQAEQSKIILNRLIGREPSLSVKTEDTVIISYRPKLEQLKSSVKEQNTLLRTYRINNRIAQLQLNESKAQRWPILSFNTQYNFIRSTSEAGFSLLNQQHGLQYGVTASVPLFSGFAAARQISNAKLDVLTTKLELEEFEQEVNAQLLNAWRNFNSNLEILRLEEANIGYAKEAFTIAQERYRIGSSQVLELQDAQRTFEEAMLRLANARFSAKLSETTLRKLNGELVQ